MCELTESELAAMNALDLSEILGTPQERIKFAMDKALQYFRERNIARTSEKMAWAEHAHRVKEIEQLQSQQLPGGDKANLDEVHELLDLVHDNGIHDLDQYPVERMQTTLGRVLCELLHELNELRNRP